MKVGSEVKKIFEYLDNNKLFTQTIIDSLQDVEYCKKNLRVVKNNFPYLLPYNPRESESKQRSHNTRQSRYYELKTITVKWAGQDFFLSSQLHIEDRDKLKDWLKNNFQLNYEDIIHTASEVNNLINIPFFQKEDFDYLAMWGDKKYDKTNQKHLEAAANLKIVYLKVAKWCELIATSILEIDSTEWEVIKAPTNQGQKFSEYHWGKIFPGWTKESTHLSITPVIHNNKFVIKIDKLDTITPQRKVNYNKWVKKTGEEKIYFEFTLADVSGWDSLIAKSETILEQLLPRFEEASMKINVLAIVAKFTWNSNDWKDDPTPEDLKHGKGYAEFGESEIAGESLNFAHEILPSDKDGLYWGYSPNFNYLPQDKKVDYIFLVSRDFDKKYKIVGYYKNPIIKKGVREASNSKYKKYSAINFGAKVKDIVFLKKFIEFDVESFLTGADMAMRNFNYVDGVGVENILAKIEQEMLRDDGVPMKDLKDLKLNTIFYGPPGTGKTLEIQNLIKKHFKDEVSLRESDDQIQYLTWWQVVTHVLLREKKAMKPSEIYHHELIKNKERFTLSENIKATVCNLLQTHCHPRYEAIKYARRRAPFIFGYDEGKYFLLPDWEEVTDLPPMESKGEDRYEFVTFHQSYSYEEFVDGIRPRLTEEGEGSEAEIGYEKAIGKFLSLCSRAEKNQSKKYALFIDELNRGNVSQIFGELITLIEESKRIGNSDPQTVSLTYSKGVKFGVPNNLYIIGTMNTADKSVAPLDYALRRRFHFKEFWPDSSVVYDEWKAESTTGISKNEAKAIFECLNEKIEILRGRDYTLGHSYFLKVNSKKELWEVMYQQVIPLLSEYFHEDYEALEFVLGDKFVSKVDNSQRYRNLPNGHTHSFKILRYDGTDKSKELNSFVEAFKSLSNVNKK